MYDLSEVILELKIIDPTSWMEIEDTKPGIYLFNLTIDQKQEQHRILLE